MRCFSFDVKTRVSRLGARGGGVREVGRSRIEVSERSALTSGDWRRSETQTVTRVYLVYLVCYALLL